MRALACAGAGFLLAVLWFDLMFDVQVRGHVGADLPAVVRTSINSYYRRVTTEARPMNRLVPVAMSATIVGLSIELVRGDMARGRSAVALVLTLAAVGLAGFRTVPNAVRLGGRADDATRQSQLARSIARDHVCCLVAIAAVLALQLLPV